MGCELHWVVSFLHGCCRQLNKDFNLEKEKSSAKDKQSRKLANAPKGSKPKGGKPKGGKPKGGKAKGRKAKGSKAGSQTDSQVSPGAAPKRPRTKGPAA